MLGEGEADVEDVLEMVAVGENEMDGVLEDIEGELEMVGVQELDRVILGVSDRVGLALGVQDWLVVKEVLGEVDAPKEEEADNEGVMEIDGPLVVEALRVTEREGDTVVDGERLIVAELDTELVTVVEGLEEVAGVFDLDGVVDWLDVAEGDELTEVELVRLREEVTERDGVAEIELVTLVEGVTERDGLPETERETLVEEVTERDGLTEMELVTVIEGVTERL